MGDFGANKRNNISTGISQPIGSSQSIGAPQSIEASKWIGISHSVGGGDARPATEAKDKPQLGIAQNMDIPSQAPVINNYTVPAKKKKSMLKAMLLTVFFGPLGMFYANAIHALILIGLYFVIVQVLGSLAVWLCWLASVIWAYIDVNKFNEE